MTKYEVRRMVAAAIIGVPAILLALKLLGLVIRFCWALGIY